MDMKYLGIIRKEKGHVLMPDGFDDVTKGRTYEAIELGDSILLMPTPLDRQRTARAVG